MRVAPMQLGLGDSVEKNDMMRQTGTADEAPNTRTLRSFDSNKDKPHRWINFLAVEEPAKNFKCKQNVLVAPVLRDAKKKGLPVPAGKGSARNDSRSRLDAVVDGDCLQQSELLVVDIKTIQRTLGDAGDRVDFTQTLL